MRERNDNWITLTISITFTFFIFALYNLLRYVLRAQFDVPYTKYLELACLLFMIIPYLIGIIPSGIIFLAEHDKIFSQKLLTRQNKLILHTTTFLLNLLIIIIFFNYASVNFALHFSIKLMAISMLIIVAYGFGVLGLYFMKYAENKILYEKNKYFLVKFIFIILIIISCCIATELLYISVLQ